MEGKNLLIESLTIYHTMDVGYLGDNLVEMHTVNIWVHHIIIFNN